jgi:hypothetical protein
MFLTRVDNDLRAQFLTNARTFDRTGFLNLVWQARGIFSANFLAYQVILF